MPNSLENELTLFLAGERVPAGSYRRLDANVSIRLEREDYLPASLDGHVACYVLIVPMEHGHLARIAVVGLESRMEIKENHHVQEDTRVH